MPNPELIHAKHFKFQWQKKTDRNGRSQYFKFINKTAPKPLMYSSFRQVSGKSFSMYKIDNKDLTIFPKIRMCVFFLLQYGLDFMAMELSISRITDEANFGWTRYQIVGWFILLLTTYATWFIVREIRKHLVWQ